MEPEGNSFKLDDSDESERVSSLIRAEDQEEDITDNKTKNEDVFNIYT